MQDSFLLLFLVSVFEGRVKVRAAPQAGREQREICLDGPRELIVFFLLSFYDEDAKPSWAVISWTRQGRKKS